MTDRRPTRPLLAAAVAASAAALAAAAATAAAAVPTRPSAGAAAGSTSAAGAATDAAAPAGATATTTIRTARTRFGTILVDGRGFTLYLFTRDGRGPSRCSGACARAWPPFFVTGTLRAAGGASAAKLGTTRRSNGRRQVTYDGKPLYYYVHETRAGQIFCQDVFEFGGRWLIVRPSGRAVR